MKAKFLQWALLMAVASSFSLTSCGSDDDSDDNGGSTSGGSSTHKGHEYVDLGLSVKWATCNVGSEKPEQVGDYIAWGETAPKNVSEYDDEHYKYYGGSNLTYSKYSNKVDYKTVLEAEDDAATVNWGGSWRMPTKDEMTELMNKCVWVWTTTYNDCDKKGYIVYKKKSEGSYDVEADAHIFLPVTGFMDHKGLAEQSYGGYWTSSLRGESNDALYLRFSKGNDMYLSYGYVRYDGLNIRPVLGK